MRKRWFMVSTLFVALGLLVACGGTASSGNAPSKPITLRWAVSVAKDTNNGAQATKLGELLQQMSGGHIVADIHYGDLGGDVEIFSLLRQGALDGMFTATSTASRTYPEIGLFDLPFLFPGYKQAYAVEDGQVGRGLLDGLSKYSVKGLGYSDLGFRNLANNVRPVNSVSDLKGLKLRTLQGKIPQDTMKSLGAIPVPLAANEIYPSLQQHVVDGLDMPVPYFLTAKLYEVVKYYSISRNTFTCMMFAMSMNTWNTLSATDKQTVTKAVKAAEDWGRKYDKQLEDDGLGQLKSKGVTVNEVAYLSAFRDAVQSVYNDAGSTVGADLIAKAQAAVKAAS
jgi:tripartite ATP-independent transporter DctP family solute receptor